MATHDPRYKVIVNGSEYDFTSRRTALAYALALTSGDHGRIAVYQTADDARGRRPADPIREYRWSSDGAGRWVRTV